MSSKSGDKIQLFVFKVLQQRGRVNAHAPFFWYFIVIIFFQSFLKSSVISCRLVCSDTELNSHHMLLLGGADGKGGDVGVHRERLSHDTIYIKNNKQTPFRE